MSAAAMRAFGVLAAEGVDTTHTTLVLIRLKVCEGALSEIPRVPLLLG
jgi:hypothetical protein